MGNFAIFKIKFVSGDLEGLEINECLRNNTEIGKVYTTTGTMKCKYIVLGMA